MNRGDQLVERAADRLRELSRKAAASDGMAAKLAQPLAEDADFLLRLKPSLIAARARGETPPPAAARSDGGAASAETAVAEPQAPSERPRKARKAPAGGPNPFLVIGAALVAGIVLAKVIDWRGHAHPRH